MLNAPSRNAPCPCGSGKKYKRCCGQGSSPKTGSGRPEAALQQAVAFYQQGNFQAALQVSEQLLKQHSDEPTALEIAAASALQLGDSETAAQRFKQQISLQPDNALAHSNLCMALHNLDRDEEAFRYGQQATKLDPDLADAWNNLGNIYKSGNHLQGALEHYEKSLQLDNSDPRVHVNAGSVSQLTGDLDKATRHYEDALKIFPDFAPAHNNLGTVYRQLGKFDTAEKYFRKALDLQPGNPETLTNLGSLWFDMGETDKARSCLEQVTRDFPAYTGASINLGYLHDRLNDRDTAAQYYDRVLLNDPENATVHCNIAYSLFELGHQKEAVEHFIRALKSDPNSAKALAGLGKAMLRQDDVEKATEYIDKALQHSPWDVHAHLAKAQLDTNTREYASAITEWEQAIELQPKMSEGYIGLARLYAEQNCLDDARNQFLRAEKAAAISINLYHSWSSTEEKNNNLNEAERVAAKALEIDPSYRGLVILRAKLARRRNAYDEALELLTTIDREELRNNEILASYLFELGTVHDKLGNYTEAFSAYEAANNTKNEYIGKTFNRESDAERFTRWKTFFTAENWRTLHETCASPDATAPCPVFIVGFPRSGTSLLEQILGSHPEIAPAGELSAIHDLSGFEGDNIIGSKLPYPDMLLDPDAPLTDRKLDTMRRYYLDMASKASGMDSGIHWITDKMPHNALHLGLIALLFPRSPIIHISRHPYNSCLSAYFSNFRSAHRYTSSLEDTAIHYRNFMGMLDYYRDTLGIDFLEIHYEDLVENQETVTRQVLEHVGAPWNEACLQHHKSTRVVKTASYEQVTRKVYRSSLHRYRNYRDNIQGITSILESTLERFGYTAE